MTRFQADLLLLFAAVIWGLAFVFQKTAMDHIGPFLFIAARAVVAAVALAPLALNELQKPFVGRPSGLGRQSLIGGVLFFIGAAFQQVGLLAATVTNTGFLTGLYVVLTPLMVWAISRRAPGTVAWLAVGLAFLGTWALGGGTVGGFSYGDLLVAISAIFWAMHLVVTGGSSKFAAPITFTCLQFSVVAVIAATFAVVTEPISLAALWQAWPSIAYVGLLSSALTFTLLAVAMKHTPAPEAAVLVSTEVVFAAMAGAWLLGERLSPLGWLGAGLMFSAMLLVQLAPILERRLNARKA